MSLNNEMLNSAAGASNSFSTAVMIAEVMPTGVVVSYVTLPGNMPNANGNQAAIWQSDAPAIPYGVAPIAQQPIPTNFQQGTVMIPATLMQGAGYVVGYAVGPQLSKPGAQSWGNVAALVTIGPDGGPGTSFSSSIAVSATFPDAIIVQYNLPPGSTPGVNGAWVGLWQGSIINYNTPPLAFAPIASNMPAGETALNNVPVLRGMTYSVGLFTSGYSQSAPNPRPAAASFAFTT